MLPVADCMLAVTCMQATRSATAPADRPGLLDRQYFKQHWSVDFWRDFAVPESIADPDTPLPSRCSCSLACA